MKRGIVLFGASGSIGQQTLEVLRHHRDAFELIGIVANRSIEALLDTVKEFHVPELIVMDPTGYKKAKQDAPHGTTVRSGLEAMVALATDPRVELVVMATSGTIGLKPTVAALQAGKTVALANKEILVMAGEWVMGIRSGKILPLDSEHNAIFQCLENRSHTAISKVFLTASGGAFRDYTQAQLQSVTPEAATQHPNWRMGQKITVDCATLANKGLELIEARWLFNLEPQQLRAVIHRESTVHALVGFCDGSFLAQLCPPSMEFPIHHCLFYPQSLPHHRNSLNFEETLTLHFTPPDTQRFPCLALAYDVLNSGCSDRAILFNAANEIAVHRFLNHQCGFMDIPRIITLALDTTPPVPLHSLEDALALDRDIRARLKNLL